MIISRTWVSDKDPYNEDKMWMDFEEDEEANSKGADRKRIKTLVVDYKIAGTKGKRNDSDCTLSQFTAETGFEYLFDCPLSKI